MKTIGLIGGMSWQSTATYYRLINQMTAEALGELHSAKLVLVSVDYSELEHCQQYGDWETAAEIVAGAAEKLERAGADMVVICTNTMHKIADVVTSRTSLPLVHAAEATANALLANGVSTVGLLGTRYTMCQDFYTGLLENTGLNVILPEPGDINMVNSVIFNELCHDIFNDNSKREYIRVIESMKKRGAEGVILGFAEIGLLVPESDSPLPTYDTTRIHAHAAVHRALADEKNSRLPRL